MPPPELAVLLAIVEPVIDPDEEKLKMPPPELAVL